MANCRSLNIHFCILFLFPIVLIQDGICCDYGHGGYVGSFGGKVLFKGGDFRYLDYVKFEIPPAPSPTTIPSSSPSMSISPSFTPSTFPTDIPSSTPSSNDDCKSGLFKIVLKTDNYGPETTWKIYNRKNMKVVIQGTDTYESNVALEFPDSTSSYCLPPGECFYFVISDSYGDGICCSYGKGHFTGLLDGRLIFEGGQFKYSDWKEFCVGKEKPICQGGAHFKFGLTTDSYGGETTWEIYNNKNQEIIGKGLGPYTSNVALEFSYCLSPGECYVLKIKDSWGDGICCNYGNGGYKGFLNGTAIFEGGIFGSEDYREFCIPEEA
eukprot:jgi/Psemu1/311259/fgenesh1_kg.747_\